MSAEKFEAFDESFKDLRKFASLSVHDWDCNYQHFTKYLMNGLASKLTQFKITYYNPEPYRHSQYLKDDIVTCLNVNSITKLHV